jgi:hypothetical protein
MHGSVQLGSVTNNLNMFDCRATESKNGGKFVLLPDEFQKKLCSDWNEDISAEYRETYLRRSLQQRGLGQPSPSAPE